jgi:AcrR family transcriptional regulator
MSKYKTNKKYQDIMNTAHNLFWRHGFRRVSVEEICRKSDVSKMTFYKFFPNKFELAKAVFDEVLDDGMRKWDEIIHADISGSEKIKRIVQMKAEGTNEISKEFMEDFYFGTQPELKSYVEQRTTEMWRIIIKGFKVAQQKGWFRKDFKPEFIFYVSNKFVEIMSDENLLSLYDSPQELILEFTNFITYGISNPENR